MDVMGIDRQLIFPQVILAMPTWSDHPSAASVLHEYNDTVMRWTKEGRGRLRPTALLNLTTISGAIAEAVNPTEYTTHFEKNDKTAPYYVSGSEWKDYEPAYKYGYDTYGQYQGRKFEEVESDLERNWEATKANSRLGWTEAKGAVRDGWHHIERAMPGDADRDGR